MTTIPAARNLIQIEETRYRAAVSEGVAQRMGAVTNFIVQQVYLGKAFFVNGDYTGLTIPYTEIDGKELFVYKANLVQCLFSIKNAGTGGTSSMDIQYASSPGGPWASIFLTPPAISYAAGNDAWCYVGSAYANTTAPVFSVPTIPALSVIRANILTAQTGPGGSGNPAGMSIALYYQPTT